MEFNIKQNYNYIYINKKLRFRKFTKEFRLYVWGKKQFFIMWIFTKRFKLKNATKSVHIQIC